MLTFKIAGSLLGNYFSIQSDTSITGVSTGAGADLVLSAVPAPTAVNSAITATEDTTYSFKVADFGFSDAVAADTLGSITITSLPTTDGTLYLNTTGTPVAVTAGEVITAAELGAGDLTFVPNTNSTAAGSFQFQVTDSLGGTISANTATMDITINVPPAPTAVNSAITATEDTTYSFKVADFGFSDAVAADTLGSITITSLPTTDGTLYLNTTGTPVAVTAGEVITAAELGAGDLTFVPNTNSTAAGSFQFQVTDSLGGTISANTATMDITINVPSAPTAVNSAITATEDTTYSFKVADFGFSDAVAADTLGSITITSLPTTDGTLYLNTTGTPVAVTAGEVITAAELGAGDLTFVPNTNSTAAGSFQFHVTDSLGGTISANTATMDITINVPSADQWINANGGSWYDTANASINWAFGIPVSAENVSISTPTSSNVTVGSDTLVNTLATIAGSTLEITSGTFTILNGTGTNGNAGTILVNGGATLQLTGMISNNGKIWINSQSASAATLLIQGDVTLQGTGVVQLDPSLNPQDFIYGAAAGGTLDNFSTIVGSGNIGNSGDGNLTLVNQAGGVINATNSSYSLFVDTGNQFVNDGPLEASNGADLVIQDPLNNEGGTVSIQDGTVELAITNSLIANFSGLGGTLQLDKTVTGGAAAGVDATSTGTTAAMTITGAGSVTSTGSDGIDATSAGGDIMITPAGSVTGAVTGIAATQDGDGNVTISVGSNSTITGSTIAGTAQYGIEALSFGSGDLSVSTATGDTVDSDSGSAGILAVNEAAAISADSSITVTAYGTINSGTTATGSGNRPGGILAGYLGGTGASIDTPNAAVVGDVFVYNYANITALAGDGIRAVNYGTGNVTVTDEANTTIQTTGTNGQYGIEGFNDGTGDIIVSTSTGDMVESAGTGILAVNEATAIAVGADSSITVTAYGTINSGSAPNTSGSAPAGILAGYNPGGNDEPETGVTGTVVVNNCANITAAGSWGIDAFNYGNGDVTVNDNVGSGAVASTAISGAQYGIGAYANSGGTGDVTVNIGTNASISTSNASTALYGVEAYSSGTGNITVLMSAGDFITSGSDGILAGQLRRPDGADKQQYFGNGRRHHHFGA